MAAANPAPKKARAKLTKPIAVRKLMTILENTTKDLGAEGAEGAKSCLDAVRALYT